MLHNLLIRSLADLSAASRSLSRSLCALLRVPVRVSFSPCVSLSFPLVTRCSVPWRSLWSQGGRRRRSTGHEQHTEEPPEQGHPPSRNSEAPKGHRATGQADRQADGQAGIRGTGGEEQSNRGGGHDDAGAEDSLACLMRTQIKSFHHDARSGHHGAGGRSCLLMRRRRSPARALSPSLG